MVELELTQSTSKPPHTEDERFDPNSLRFLRRVQEREKVLQWSLFGSVGAIFEQEIHSDFGFYVMDCMGPRSIGTIMPATVTEVKYEPEREGDAWDYRLHFYDADHNFYRLKITDLTWHYYCDSMRNNGKDPKQIA